MVAVTIRNAFLRYDQKILFDHLSLSFAEGKCTCLLGPSGVGKSTLLRLIAGLIISKDKTHVTGDISRKKNIAYMAQSDLLLPWYTAFDNALLGAKLRGERSSALEDKAHGLFSALGLEKAKQQFPQQLSGGMRQRVALIRTLLENQPIILMDEPFSSIDAITRFELQTLTTTLLKGKTIILITHDPIEALRMADCIYVLSGKPAVISKELHFSSATPRHLTDPDVVHYEEIIFKELATAKAEMAL